VNVANQFDAIIKGKVEQDVTANRMRPQVVAKFRSGSPFVKA